MNFYTVLKERSINEYIDDKLDLFEMANVRSNKTGLKMVIYISPRIPGVKHGPRINVSKQYGDKVNNDFFSISFGKNTPATLIHKNTGSIKNNDLKDILSFVDINKQTLLDLWYDKIDVYDAISKFVKI